MPSIRDMIAKVESKESAKQEKKALTRGVRPDHIMSGAYGIGESGLVKGGASANKVVPVETLSAQTQEVLAEELRQSITLEAELSLAAHAKQSLAAEIRTAAPVDRTAPVVSPAERETEKPKPKEKARTEIPPAPQFKSTFTSDAQSTPSTAVPAPKLEIDGFFKTTHALFFDSAIRKLSGESFRVFLFLHSRAWQFASSNGQVRASISFIELALGVSSATISRALDELKTAGLIRMAKKDFKLGNIWEVQSLAVYRGVVSGVMGNVVMPAAEAVLESQVSENPIQSHLPANEGLKNYFLSVRPEPKKRSEKVAFNELLKSFTEDEIAQCYQYLNQHGALKTGMVCHSPMSYLGLAMAEVLEAANLDKNLIESRLVNAKFEAQARLAEQQAIEADEKQWLMKEHAFLNAFPDSQMQAQEIATICRGNSVASYGPQLMRRFAINQWWTDRIVSSDRL